MYLSNGIGNDVFDMESYLFEAKEVYERKFVVIDWYSLLVGLVRARFSARDGTMLVHLRKTPVLERETTIHYFVNALCPWRNAIDKVTQR